MQNPKENVLVAARSILSNAEKLVGEGGLRLSGEEYETVAAARVTLAEIQRRSLILFRRGTIGEAAHAEVGRAIAENLERREALDLRGSLRALIDSGAVPAETRVETLLRRLDELLAETHPG